MKKFFAESEMELVLFSFDVLTTSGDIIDDQSYDGFDNADSVTSKEYETAFTI